MFEKFLKSSLLKNSKSDNFMNNVSNGIKWVKISNPWGTYTQGDPVAHKDLLRSRTYQEVNILGVKKLVPDKVPNLDKSNLNRESWIELSDITKRFSALYSD
ncbi:MAG: hypothetical protein U0354_13750 [Candidatus Sericytochromatia bacterium]